MRKIKIFVSALLAVLCLAFLGGCGSSENSGTTDTDADNPSYWATQQFDTLSGSDFVKVGESGNLQLLVNPSSGVIRWLDTSTGVYKDSNLTHDEGMSSTSNNQKSDVLVKFFSGAKKANKLYWNTTTYDSYSMAVDLEQISYQYIDNGVRILYTLGDDSVTYKNFPNRISDERMQEYVIQYLDNQQLDILKNRYTQISSGEWIRGFGGGENGAQNRIPPAGIAEIYNIFYVVGQYTDDLLYEDLEASDTEESEYPNVLEIKIPVEYYLENGQLVVNVDTTLIETDEDHPINTLQLLPYFLTSDTSIDAEDGYMFVPDGSGALMYLDSTKTREYHYQASYYGGDPLNPSTAKTYRSVSSKMQLPVFGMKSSDSTIFAVIEEGAEVATLDTYISGTNNSEPFCSMQLTFTIQAQQVYGTGSTNANGEFSLYKVSDDIYDEDITIRYFWLDEGAGYTEMADCYSNYLEEKGILTKNTQDEDPPFFVEFLGTTDKTLYFLGIPYEGTQALTTFSQAQEILEHLNNVGVSNVKVIYSGIVNGGINQRSLSSSVKFAPGLGGSSSFNSLKSYADSVGAEIYPNVLLQTANTKAKLPNDVVAWNGINERAQIYTFDPVGNALETDVDFPLYIISPNALGSYLNNAKKSYLSRTGLTTLASEDLYTFVATNYKDNHVSPSTGIDLLEEAVGDFADGMSLMLSNPIVDGYAYADYLMDIPVEDGGMRILDASVPFMGMVLDGYIQYSAESSNRESTDVFLNIMHAIESNAQPKFTIMYESSSLLTGTEQENYFAVDYNYWKDQIGYFYELYRDFYDAVKGATIVNHEIYERNDKLRVETYSNGVKVYFNYSDLDEVIDGVLVPAFSYIYQ